MHNMLCVECYGFWCALTVVPSFLWNPFLRMSLSALISSSYMYSNHVIGHRADLVPTLHIDELGHSVFKCWKPNTMVLPPMILPNVSQISSLGIAPLCHVRQWILYMYIHKTVIITFICHSVVP